MNTAKKTALPQPKMLPVSKIAELKREIAAIANVPKANGEQAVMYAGALTASYPGQQAPDERVAAAYQRQLVETMIGVDIDVLESVLSPKYGLVSRQKFLPAVAEVAEFIQAKMGRKAGSIGFMLDQIESIERAHEPQLSEDDRAANAKRLHDLASVIRQTAKAAQRANPPLPAWQATEEEAQRGRLEGLKALEAMRIGGSNESDIVLD
jgi:hypothetical protein